MELSKTFMRGALQFSCRTDYTVSRSKAVMIQEVTPASRTADVLNIYEEVANQVRHQVEQDATPQEYAIFDKTFNNIVSPHLKYDYKYLDRNYDSVSSIAHTVEKIESGTIIRRDILHPDISIPALFAQLHQHVPLDDDGLPMIIDFDQEIDDPEHI